MLNHPDYLTITQYATDNNLTRQQVIDATPQQFKAVVGHSVSNSFAAKVKRILVSAFDQARDDGRLNDIKAEVKTYLDANFPNWKAERGKAVGNDDQAYPFVKIWLKGLPPGDILNG